MFGHQIDEGALRVLPSLLKRAPCLEHAHRDDGECVLKEAYCVGWPLRDQVAADRLVAGGGPCEDL